MRASIKLGRLHWVGLALLMLLDLYNNHRGERCDISGRGRISIALRPLVLANHGVGRHRPANKLYNFFLKNNLAVMVA